MRGLIMLTRWLWAGLITVRAYLPYGFSAIMILLTIAKLIFTDPSQILPVLGTTVFGAEYQIHTNVALAIAQSPEYTLFAFFQIINGIVILYILTRILTKMFIGWTGSQAQWGAATFSIGIVAVIEFSALRFVNGVTFVPIKDGLWYLLMNLGPVFNNIIWPWHALF